MDPISTLALVSSIFQVVDFSTKVLSNMHQIYQNSIPYDRDLTWEMNYLASLNDKMKEYKRTDLSHCGALKEENQVCL